MHVLLLSCLLFTSSQLLAMDDDPSLSKGIAKLAIHQQRSQPVAIPGNLRAMSEGWPFQGSPFSFGGDTSRPATPDCDDRKPSPALPSVGTPSDTSTSSKYSDSHTYESANNRSLSVGSSSSSFDSSEAADCLRGAYWQYPGQPAAPVYYSPLRSRSASVSAASKVSKDSK